MKLHEHQAKDLLRKWGVPTLESRVCFTLDDARKAISELGVPCVIKAQVHAGGRGKAGGVKVALNDREAMLHAENILGMTIKTAQTGTLGQKVSCILVEQGAVIKHELYLGIVIDRECSKICLMASTQGGVDIEEVAARDPQAIKKIYVDKSVGIMPYQIRELALELSLANNLKRNFVTMITGAYQAFVDYDASMVEINPLVVTKEDKLLALDAKIIIDDNALYRQKLVSQMRDPSQEDEKEVRAQHHGLSYVALDGTIGCMVNGAGLAMATMDIIKHVGGSPANFLDVGGSATKERVEEALRIIVSDPKVKSIFVNVFGGIAKCDVIAQGIISAAKSLRLTKPLIVRLQGTNVDLGKDLLSKSGLAIKFAGDMLSGAKLAVESAL